MQQGEAVKGKEDVMEKTTVNGLRTGHGGH